MTGKEIYRHCRRAFYRAIFRAWDFNILVSPAYSELRPSKIIVPRRMSHPRRFD
jgi:hypothetical protein